ncbi:MAG: hypothetical protein AAB539_02545 [Patescibacteria group bacterium]|jgi:hypothetical protein
MDTLKPPQPTPASTVSMRKKPKQQGLLIVLLLFTAVAGLWWYFSPLIADLERESEKEDLDLLIAPLRPLKDIALDTAVFDDPLLEKLVRPVIPPPPPLQKGRANPFQ